VLVEVDLNGARAIKLAVPEAVTVFVEPPSLAELERRLRGRGTESEEQYQRRLRTAIEELAARDEFDVALVNHDVQVVAAALVELLVGPRDALPDGALKAPAVRSTPQESSS
jgi:guanylate kinase